MILNSQRRVRVALEPLEVFLDRAMGVLRRPVGALTICLLSDARIARLNRSFRGKQGPTDVLSFPAHARTPPPQRNGHARESAATSPPSYLGDIAISTETARRNARRFGRTLDEELRVLILHGVLHLLGYDHETDSGQMARLERRLRRRLGLDGR